jgi:hypothetical protein
MSVRQLLTDAEIEIRAAIRPALAGQASLTQLGAGTEDP